MASYHPSLMIMAKTIGWRYLETTDVVAVKRQVSAATGSVVRAADAPEFVENPAVMPMDQVEFRQLMDRMFPIKQPRKNLTDQQKSVMYRDHGMVNIQAVADHVSQEDIAEYKDWYRQAHEDCRAAVDELGSAMDPYRQYDPLRVFIGVVAATSQRTLWENNVELAKQVVRAGAEKIGQHGLTLTDANLKKARQVLSGDFGAIDTDAKFGPFNNSILNPDATADVVVVDTHMIAMWLGKRLSVQSPEFEAQVPTDAGKTKVAVDTARVARKMGLTNQSAQAVLWSAWRKMPPGYSATDLAFRTDRNPEWDLFQALYPYLSGKVWTYKPYRTHQDDPVIRDLGRRYRQKIREAPDKEAAETVKRQQDALYQAIKGRGVAPDEWDDLVQQYGTNLYRFYGIAKKSWDQFLAENPEWRARLSRTEARVHDMSVARLLDVTADRIVAGPDPVMKKLADQVAKQAKSRDQARDVARQVFKSKTGFDANDRELDELVDLAFPEKPSSEPVYLLEGSVLSLRHGRLSDDDAWYSLGENLHDPPLSDDEPSGRRPAVNAAVRAALTEPMFSAGGQDGYELYVTTPGAWVPVRTDASTADVRKVAAALGDECYVAGWRGPFDGSVIPVSNRQPDTTFTKHLKSVTPVSVGGMTFTHVGTLEQVARAFEQAEFQLDMDMSFGLTILSPFVKKP